MHLYDRMQSDPQGWDSPMHISNATKLKNAFHGRFSIRATFLTTTTTTQMGAKNLFFEIKTHRHTSNFFLLIIDHFEDRKAAVTGCFSFYLISRHPH